jgi:hypothetical protein
MTTDRREPELPRVRADGTENEILTGREPMLPLEAALAGLVRRLGGRPATVDGRPRLPTDEELAEFESVVLGEGLALPTDYRLFLLRHGGTVLDDDDRPEVRFDLPPGDPSGPDDRLRALLGLNPPNGYDLEGEFRSGRGAMPDRFLPIGLPDAPGALVCLSLAEPDAGRVFRMRVEQMWEWRAASPAEREELGLACFATEVAGSFAGFLAGLRTLEPAGAAVDGGASRTSPAEPPEDPMRDAVTAGDVQMLRGLLIAGVRPDRPDAFGMLPCENAAADSRIDTLRLLLTVGAPLGRAMHLAASAGQVKTLTLLLDRGFPADLREPGTGRTPLMAALHDGGHEEAVRFLLSRGADPAARDSAGLGVRDHALLSRRKARLLPIVESAVGERGGGVG